MENGSTTKILGNTIATIDGVKLNKGAKLYIEPSGKESFVKLFDITNGNGGTNGIYMAATMGAQIFNFMGDKFIPQDVADRTIATLKKKLEAAEMQDKLDQLTYGSLMNLI